MDYIGPKPCIKARSLGIAENIKIGTWNAWGVSTKDSELIKKRDKMQMNITVITLIKITITKKKFKGME